MDPSSTSAVDGITAANQARRRTDMALDLAEANVLATSKAFAYKPLDPDADCIRLLYIEPAVNQDDPITCTLKHVAFKERPKFEALSYMWGDETVMFEILIDGAKFEVGLNLRDGLRVLRARATPMPVWIDAVCINQRDISERSRQVRIMHHIYYRAQSVIVWLGQKYSDYQDSSTAAPSPTEQDASDDSELTLVKKKGKKVKSKRKEVGRYLPLQKERRMVSELCADGYWDRVWIIQEIGKARQIQVCCGHSSISWNDFISLIELHENGDNGPLRLNRQLQQKYKAGHTLRKLLEDHRHALCQEPRDKIYGLVGLAQDASGFPVDYGRSLLEIWIDTMEFMNGHKRLPTADVITVGRMVKDMLIGADLGPLEQVLRPSHSPSELASNIGELDGPGVYQLETYIVGCVRHIGPTIGDIVATLSEADRWTGMIQENFNAVLGDAHKENDLLLKTILEADEVRPIACYDHVSHVQWTMGGDDKPWEHPYSLEVELQQKRAAETAPQDAASSSSGERAATEGRHLFQFSPRPGTQFKKRSEETPPWKLGIASSQTKPGDLVCWTKGTNKAMVVRIDELSRCQVVGTALVAGEISVPSLFGSSRDFGSFEREDKFPVKIDSATVFVLVA